MAGVKSTVHSGSAIQIRAFLLGSESPRGPDHSAKSSIWACGILLDWTRTENGGKSGVAANFEDIKRHQVYE